MVVVGVVGKAGVFLLGILQHQAEAHPLAHGLAVGQAAHAREHRFQPGLFVPHEVLAGGGALGPSRGDPLKVRDQQIRRSGKILGPAVTIAVRAVVTLRIVGPGVVAGAVAMAVQVLPESRNSMA